MTEYERMVKGLLYNPGDEEILNEQFPFLDKLWNFNQLKPSDFEKKTAYMKEVFAECGENCYIELPFRANWGGLMCISALTYMPTPTLHVLMTVIYTLATRL